MFLFRWCMNALRCRRDLTLETTPLSPAKYNGLPSALDCSLQRQLVDNISPASPGLDDISRLQLDEGDPVDPPCFLLQDHENTFCSRRVVDEDQDSVTVLINCHCESCDTNDVTTSEYFRPADVDEPSSLLSADDVTANGINTERRREHETVENTPTRDIYSSGISRNSATSSTDFRSSSSQSPQPNLQQELQQRCRDSHKDSSPIISNEYSVIPGDTQDADDVGFSGEKSSRFTYDARVFDVSHRSVLGSFPVDTLDDPLVTLGMLLVNCAVTVAVRILADDATMTSEPSPINESDLLPVSDAPNSVKPSSDSNESINTLADPIQAAASRLVNQVLSEVVQKCSSSAFACPETLPDETSINAGGCAARSPYSAASSSPCSRRCELTADNNVQSCATADADRVLNPAAAAEDYLSESSAADLCTDAERQVLAANELNGAPSGCDCKSMCALDGGYESTTALSAGRLALVSQVWRPVSPPFTDSCSPDEVLQVLNNNSVVVGLFDGVDPRRYPHCDDSEARMMCSETATERDVDLSGNGNADDTTKVFVDDGTSDDDSCADKRPSRENVSENTAGKTWNSCESNCRYEDYFFHRYIIPVDQLEAGEATPTTDSDSTSADATSAHSDKDEQRSKMQLDLTPEEPNNGADVDAEIAAVAAFCRAMFTPVETDTEDNDDGVSAFDALTSPESADEEDRWAFGGRPLRVRRCISLRTSPGTPHKKKSVRFADALGLDLECVRQIQTVDDSPLTGSGVHDESRLPRRPLLAEASAAWRRPRLSYGRRYLCACFQAPGSHPDFIDRVRRSRVVLESYANDDRALTITGVVRVANVAFRKMVAARVTTDGWTTQTDVTAEYVPRSNDGTTDRFSFQIALPHGATELGRRVEFAVYFTAFFDGDSRCETYWDNNFGANYCFECYGGRSVDDDDDDDDDDSGTVTSDSDMYNADGQFGTWLRFV